ncbi:MAG: hypothetical protein R3268_10715, partial [Acidiferrobacterales bacterium]|nr:hypothetical protein [Acidiferrobacterales bacterium]
ERQIQLRRRLESIKHIHQASDTLEDRMNELEHIRAGMVEQQKALNKRVEDMLLLLNSAHTVDSKRLEKSA